MKTSAIRKVADVSIPSYVPAGQRLGCETAGDAFTVVPASLGFAKRFPRNAGFGRRGLWFSNCGRTIAAACLEQENLEQAHEDETSHQTLVGQPRTIETALPGN